MMTLHGPDASQEILPSLCDPPTSHGLPLLDCMELVRSEFAVRCTRHSQSSGYIYTSFQKTAKIWWDPWQGGDGAIYSTIDGSGSGYPIAEVNNCSRIIKYVVTVGQRYSSYSLVDMRVHDINVVADLTRHDPTAPNPEENDGTVRGLKPCAAAVSFVDSMVSMSASNTVSWWTGWWPVIHVKTFGSLESGASFSYQIAVDLLGTVSLEDMSIATAREDGYDDATIQAMVNQGDADFLAELGMGLTLIAAEIILVVAIELLMQRAVTTLPTPWTLAIFAILLAAYVGLVLLALQMIYDGLVTGRLTAFVALELLFVEVGILGITGWMSNSVLSRTWTKWWHCRGLWYGTGTRSRVTYYLSVLVVAAKVLLFALVMSTILRCINVMYGGQP